MRFTNSVKLRIALACLLGSVAFCAVFSIAYFIMARHQIVDLIFTDIVSTQRISVLIIRLLLSTIFASYPAHVVIKTIWPKKSQKSPSEQKEIETA
jgi:hypothetical protein